MVFDLGLHHLLTIRVLRVFMVVKFSELKKEVLSFFIQGVLICFLFLSENSLDLPPHNCKSVPTSNVLIEIKIFLWIPVALFIKKFC